MSEIRISSLRHTGTQIQGLLTLIHFHNYPEDPSVEFISRMDSLRDINTLVSSDTIQIKKGEGFYNKGIQ